MFKAGLTTIIGILAIQTGVLAQIHVKNPGNVGIGTSTPATKLDVNGDITAGNPGGGYHLIVNDVPTARWAFGTGDHKIHIASDYPVTSTWEDKFVITKEGNVGIGESWPSAKLTVPNNASASFRVGVNSNMANTHSQLINSLAVLGDNHDAISSITAAAWNFFNNGNSPSWSGTVLNHVGTNVGGDRNGIQARNQGTLLFQNVDNGVIATNGQTNIYVTQANSVTAAFYATGSTRFQVNGDMKANTYWAGNNAHWPDYVFDSAYHLPSLPAIKSYINQHHHLPEVPSAEEVNRDGINLGANQAILLKKIEELTLYVIEQNEKLTALAAENAELKRAVTELKANTKRKRK
jgi:hypothetical protein